MNDKLVAYTDRIRDMADKEGLGGVVGNNQDAVKGFKASTYSAESAFGPAKTVLDVTIDDAGQWTGLVKDFNALLMRSEQRLEAAQTALRNLATAYDAMDQAGARGQSNAANGNR